MVLDPSLRMGGGFTININIPADEGFTISINPNSAPGGSKVGTAFGRKPTWSWYIISHNPKTNSIINLIKHNLKINLNLKKNLMEKRKKKNIWKAIKNKKGINKKKQDFVKKNQNKNYGETIDW